MASARTTTDHDTIRRWAEERGGRPTRVKNTETGGEGAGVLRIDFAEPDEGLEAIDWDTFFDTFEERGLALLFQEKTDDGSVSRFNKIVSRDGA